MNQITSRLQGYRKSMIDIGSSSDSETDSDDDRPSKKFSGQSIFSGFGAKKSKTGLTTEYDTADFDITQWELAVQIHMDKVNSFPKESLWPRDILFKYYQVMERLQENLQERREIFKLFSQCMLNDHDT